jgi:hypothetical protein
LAGAAGGGKDAVYAGCELEPMEWSATKAMICSGKVFSRLVFSAFCFCLFLVQSFGFPQRLLSERELCLMVLGLSFYPLEQAPNMVIYAMSKNGTATSGLI